MTIFALIKTVRYTNISKYIKIKRRSSGNANKIIFQLCFYFRAEGVRFVCFAEQRSSTKYALFASVDGYEQNRKRNGNKTTVSIPNIAR